MVITTKIKQKNTEQWEKHIAVPTDITHRPEAEISGTGKDLYMKVKQTTTELANKNLLKKEWKVK